MSSSRFASYLYLLTLVFLAQTVVGVDPLYNICYTANFSVDDPYASNLNNLISYLWFQAPPSGFGLGSIGKEPNQAYGFALCRGDVKTPDCKSCILEAGNEIRKRCSYNKDAIIWYDSCLLKYSDKEFFGQIDEQSIFTLCDVNTVEDPKSFNQKIKKLLSQLANEAYESPKLFATGEMELNGGSHQKLYGLTQCTRDLSSSNCKNCLDGIISLQPSCCNGTQGGRVTGANCNFRYEIYPFVDA